MNFIRIFAVFAAIWYQPAAARLQFGDEICLTHYSSKPTAHVPTHYSRTTVTCTFTARYTTTPTITVTPTSFVSTTVTTTATTTLPQQTDTYTSTTTSTDTYVVFTTPVSTSTVTTTTTTTSTGTITVSVAANFTPFASEAAVIAAGGGTSGSSKRSEQVQYPRRGLGSTSINKRNLGKLYSPNHKPVYISEVTCYIFVERLVKTTTTITAHKTKTKTAPTTTSTITQTVGTTITVDPAHASTTVTDTSTTTTTTTSSITSTTVTTTTITSTTVAPSETYYPQCQSNNLIEYVGGKHLYYISPGSSSPHSATTSDAVTCCELCANTAGCSGFSGPTAGFSDCYIFTTSTCDASVPGWTVYTSVSPPSSDVDIVGNGNCGQGQYGGDF